ncbi:MAG: fasciclin domain-containing protein [Alphaproteobacteria bacterium]
MDDGDAGALPKREESGMFASPFDLDAEVEDSETRDPFEEDTVFLAPRLVFTPGGARDAESDEHGAGIESPFAKSKKTTGRAPAPAIRPVWSGDQASASAVEPTSRTGEQKPFMRRRPRQVETGLSEAPSAPQSLLARPERPPQPAKPELPVTVETPEESSTRPSPPLPLSPTLTRPRPVQPAWARVAEAAAEERAQDTEAEPVSARAGDGQVADDRASSDLFPPIEAQPTPSIVFPPADIDIAPGGPPTAITESGHEPPKATIPSPPAKGRLAVRWLVRAGKGVLTGLVSGAGICWRACLAQGARLWPLAQAAGVLGKSLAVRLALSLAALCRFALRIARGAMDQAGKAARASLPVAGVLAGKGYAALGRVGDAGTLLKNRLLQMSGPLSAALNARHGSPRTPGAATPKDADVAAAGQSPDLPPFRLVSPRLLSLGLLSPRLLSIAWPPSKAVMALTAAAAVLLLTVVFGPVPTMSTDSAALTFPIPARPAEASTIEKRVEPGRVETAPGPATQSESLRASALPDPIKAMVDYVSRRSASLAQPREANPVLASLAPLEGLGEFVRAAETVGLGELLQPGRSYTLFVPNDGAFAKLAPGEIEGLLQPSGHVRLLTLLSHHIVSERLAFDDLAGHASEYTSLAGQPLTIDATERVRIGDAGMVEADLQVSGSVVHVVDTVLTVPPSP